jgi:hypothetical protein
VVQISLHFADRPDIAPTGTLWVYLVNYKLNLIMQLTLHAVENLFNRKTARPGFPVNQTNFHVYTTAPGFYCCLVLLSLFL